MENLTRNVKAIPLRRFQLSRSTERMPAPYNFGNLRCRTVTPEDAPLIGNLLYTCFHGEIDDDGQTAEQWRQLSRNTFRHGICTRSSLVLFDGRTAVSAIIVVPNGNERSLDLAMTSPKYRGQHLAEGLIRQSLHNLACLGISRLSLWVTEGNSAAQRLYRKLDFSKQAELYHLKVVIS